MDPKESSEIKAKMDAAALFAAKSFPTSGTAKDVSDWMKKHYMAAGYKRLSKIVLASFGN